MVGKPEATVQYPASSGNLRRYFASGASKLKNFPSRAGTREMKPSPLATKRMIVVMLEANYIAERLSSLKQELSDLRVTNARYWSRSTHTASEKSARALHQERLLHIKRELSDLMKRCANERSLRCANHGAQAVPM